MFIAYQGDLAVQYGTDMIDLHNRCLFIKIDRIEEVDYDVCLHNGKITPVAEIKKEEEVTVESEVSAKDEQEA
nr:MAG TPA: hypothetical protein [Caudoviricetes sp.]